MKINWKKFIHSDQHVLLGKPVVRGTRLSVEFLLGLLAKGWSEKQILKSYPSLTEEGLQAVFAFTVVCMREEALYPIPREAVK